MPVLSIVIPSLVDRHDQLEALITAIHRMPRSSEVELVIEIDNGEVTTGHKRNVLVGRATGDYIAHVDDDDHLSPEYVPRVLEAIETAPAPPVDVVLIRGIRTMPTDMAKRPHHAQVIDFRIRHKYGLFRDTIEDGRTLWQWPNHLCPVRAPLAKSTPFPDLTRGEDLIYKRNLFPKLRTFVHANPNGDPLYFYRFNPAKGRRSGPP